MQRHSFSFGRNWKRYVKRVVNEEVIEMAVESLKRFLPKEVWDNKVFIDVGCGNGLFSLAALKLGCKEVVSFDVDPYSIEATLELKDRFSCLIKNKGIWHIFQGSILDDNLVNKFKQYGDIVYSWGVLHHTGDMWNAIEKASRLVKINGYFIIAVYNHAPSSDFWLKVKKFYNRRPLLSPIIAALYGSFYVVGYIIKNRTFRLKRARGMHVFYDVIDWLGGLPYEYACAEEVCYYVKDLGFSLEEFFVRLPCGKGKRAGLWSKIRASHTGCNEFLFKRVN